jgi:hypothetical protein
MSHAAPVEDLADQAIRVLREYLSDHKTDRLKELAPLIVDLRGSFHLDDGRPDWSGRSPGYRQVVADIYTKARVPEDKLDTVQAALRYHVGNLLRERTPPDELAAVGLKARSPKERLANHRQALAAQRELAAPRGDAARLAAYAQALTEFIDEDAIPDLPPERAVATRIALEAVQSRSAQLLVRLADAASGRQVESSRGGKHRRAAGLRGV